MSPNAPITPDHHASAEEVARLREELDATRSQLARLEKIYETAPVGLCVLDTGQHLRRCNTHMARIRQRVRSWSHAASGQEAPDLAEVLHPLRQEVCATGTPIIRREVSLPPPPEASEETRPRTLRVSLHPLPTTDGPCEAVAGVVQDITDVKRLEATAQHSQTHLRNATEIAGVLVYESCLRTGHILSMQGLRTLLGEKPPPAPTQAWWAEHVHPDDRAACLETIERANEHAASFSLEYRLCHADGHYLHVHENASIVRDEAGRPVRHLGVVMDVTRRWEAEEALRRLNETLESQVTQRTEQVQVLARALVIAEQRERMRISQVLHDDLQQLLYGLRMRLAVYRSQHPAGDPGGPSDTSLQVLGHLTDRAIQTTRTLSVELNPPVLAREGLAAALRWLVRHMQEHHRLGVEMTLHTPLTAPNREKRVLVVQIARELLFNVVKHADADTAALEARSDEAGLTLVVRDEGRGFDPDRLQRNQQRSLGLFSIAERLRLFGGHVDVSSQPGEGTRCTVWLPH